MTRSFNNTEKGIECTSNKNLDPVFIAESLLSLEQWEIDHNDLELQKRIGSGGFAEVFSGYRKSDGTIVAVKRLHKQEFDKNSLEMFKREVSVLASFHHFAILPFVGACTRPPYCIVTQFMSGGSLFARLHAKDSSDRLTSTQLSIIALGIAYGMTFLHEREMIHRDLKSLNILLDSDDYPKICDFGMARTKSTGSEPMTGEIGTSQWMAPEVLVSQNYDEKADVYSYGIILWEMLTGDIPYRGLRDIQVAMAVVNQNNRPKIPKNCPQNLSNFIRVCWSADPKKRPDFHTIVRALESGAISFPGTDISQLKAYVSQFATPNIQIVDSYYSTPIESEIQTIPSSQLFQLIDDFNKDNNSVLSLISVLSHNKGISLIKPAEIIPTIISRLADCSDAHTASHLVSLLSLLFYHKSMVAFFVDYGGDNTLLELLPRFCTSMIPKLLDCLIQVLTIKSCIFYYSHISKISPFLLCSDLSIRLTAIMLINRIVDNTCYEDNSIFVAIIEFLLRNATPESKIELLNETLLLINKLSHFKAVLSILQQSESIDRIIPLLNHQNLSIQKTIIKLLKSLFSNNNIKPKVIDSFLDCFMRNINSNDSETVYDLICILILLLDNLVLYKEISTTKNISSSFVFLLKHHEYVIQVSSLKALYALCSNSITSQLFSNLFPNVSDILYVENCISKLASYILSAILSYSNQKHILSHYGEKISHYLIDSLNQNKDHLTCSLRMIGVLTQSMDGISFIEQNGLLSLIPVHINSTSLENRKLTLMVIDAISNYIPDLIPIYDSIPTLIQFSRNADIGHYTLSILSNITVQPTNAAICIGYLPEILQLTSNQKSETREKALVILHRVLLTQEARNLLNRPEIVENIVNSLSNLWEGPQLNMVIDIIDSLSSIEQPLKVLQNIDIGSIILKQMKLCSIDDPIRTKFLRVKSRLF